MSITDNTNTLRLILDKANNLPNSSGGSGGGSVQTATGSFTTSGNSNYIDVECGFTPDMLIVYLPDEYSVYGEFCKNDVGIDLTGVTLEDERVQGVGMFGTEDSDVMDITLSLVNVRTHSSGFYITAVYEQDLTGDWWFSNGKTYRYKAIKFNGEASDTPQGNGWYDNVYYNYTVVPNSYAEINSGNLVSYEGWSRTPYLPCENASRIRVEVVHPSEMITYGYSGSYNVFYDASNNFICTFSFNGIDEKTVGSYVDIDVPSNASYFVISGHSEVLNYNGDPCIKIKPIAQESTGTGWVSNVAYGVKFVHDVYIETNGVQTAYDGWSATDYLPCKGISDIIARYTEYANDSSYESVYNAFYDKDKKFICNFAINNNNQSKTPISIKEYNNMSSIPENAEYVRFSHSTDRLTLYGFTPIG